MPMDFNRGEDGQYRLEGVPCTILTGSVQEWLKIAEVLKTRGHARFKRAAVYWEPIYNWYVLCCPRNQVSSLDNAMIDEDEAAALADLVHLTFRQNGEAEYFRDHGFDPLTLGC